MTAGMLANHVWQSTIVAGVAWLITMALRRDHAAVRHAVWLAASLKFPRWPRRAPLRVRSASVC